MSYDNVTFLICNARSRSAWMAEVFSHVAVASAHDPLRFMSAIDGDFKAYVEGLQDLTNSTVPRVFIADSGAAMFTRKIYETFPGARFLFITRDPKEVHTSLHNLGIYPRVDPGAVLRKMKADFERMENDGAPCMARRMDELSVYEGFSEILLFSCDAAISRADHARYDALNIQCILSKHMKDVNPDQLDKLMKESEL